MYQWFLLGLVILDLNLLGRVYLRFELSSRACPLFQVQDSLLRYDPSGVLTVWTYSERFLLFATPRDLVTGTPAWSLLSSFLVHHERDPPRVSQIPTKHMCYLALSQRTSEDSNHKLHLCQSQPRALRSVSSAQPGSRPVQDLPVRCAALKAPLTPRIKAKVIMGLIFCFPSCKEQFCTPCSSKHENSCYLCFRVVFCYQLLCHHWRQKSALLFLKAVQNFIVQLFLNLVNQSTLFKLCTLLCFYK